MAQLPDKLASMYTKKPENDPSVQLADNKSRMEAILESRSRNFEASKNLTTPSIAMNMTGMSSTARVHFGQTKRRSNAHYSALAMN